MTTYDYGIKVVKDGKSISSTDLRDIIFSSKYPMLKQHSTSTGSATISQGGTSCYVDFTHNLGYVPVFLAYVSVSGFESGRERMIPGYSWGSIAGSETYNFFGVSAAYANSTSIRCTYNLSTPYNELTFTGDTIYWDLYVDPYGTVVGRPTGFGGKSSVWRVPNITLNKDQAITSANFEIQSIFSVGSGDVKYKVYSIDQDNVGGIDLGSPRTDAYYGANQSLSGGYWNFGMNVKSSVEEVLARSGWSSGNNMGFYLSDDSTDEGKSIVADTGMGAFTTVLKIVKTGSITITFRVIIFKDKII